MSQHPASPDSRSTDLASTWLCKTCAAEYPANANPPQVCPICADPRQYIPVGGQQWVRSVDLNTSHQNEIRELEPGLFGIGVTPQFGIGQISLFIPHAEGGILWEGNAHLSDETIAWINDKGGVRTMAMSHPHLYGAMISNSKKLGNVPVYLPEADRDWVMHPHDNIKFFSQPHLDVGQGCTVHVTGGHFDGSAFLHWPDGAQENGADGKGAILAGDTVFVAADRKHVAFLYSTPNHVPLGLATVRKIISITEPLAFDRIYSSWWDSAIMHDAKPAIARSEARLRKLLGSS